MLTAVIILVLTRPGNYSTCGVGLVIRVTASPDILCGVFSELCETEADGKKLIYWQVNFPFPLWNRDVSFYTVWLGFELVQNFVVKTNTVIGECNNNGKK